MITTIFESFEDDYGDLFCSFLVEAHNFNEKWKIKILQIKKVWGIYGEEVMLFDKEPILKEMKRRVEEGRLDKQLNKTVYKRVGL